MAVASSVVLVTLAVVPASAQALKLAPCESKKRFDAMPLPPTTPIIMIVGHEFRKGDVCIPIELRTRWQVRYEGSEHDLYEMTGQEVYPGEFWYRADREEFVIAANGKSYSGNDGLLALSASGEACNHGYDRTCDKWTAFGRDDAVSVSVLDSKTGAFVYGHPTVITRDEEIPAAVHIMPPHFEFRRSADVYFRPPMVTIDNLALFDAEPLTYTELTRAAGRRQPVSRTVSWNRNENTEENPSKYRGTLSFQIVFSPACPSQFRIVTPEANQKLLFSSGSPGTVTIEAEVGVANMPPDLIEHIAWSAPGKAGSELSYTRAGTRVTITYTGLPKNNSDFGPTKITATVDAGGSCGTLSASQDVLLFFPRDEKNNPAGDVPNYYYYWLQTPAGQGAVNGQDVRYVHRQFECGENPKWLGYHPRDTKLSVPADKLSQPRLVGRDYIYICDFHKYDNVYADHPSTNFYMEGVLTTNVSWEGIDTFAVIMRHELTHRNHWRDWWNPTGGSPKQGFYDTNNNRQRDPTEPWVDQDEDFIPDAREALLGYDNTEKNTNAVPGEDMYDEHHLTYTVGDSWPRGSADSQDWAKPGKQWK